MPTFPLNPIPLIRPIRPIDFPTKPKRPYKRATLGSSFGPNGNPKKAVSSAYFDRTTFHIRVKEALWEFC